MKKLFVLFGVFLTSVLFAQLGKISPKEPSKIKPGEENLFLYIPANTQKIPTTAKIAYITNYDYKLSNLEKTGNSYQFNIKIPADSKYVVFAIVDENGKSVDNNSGKMYSYFYDKNINGDSEIASLNSLQFAEYKGLIKLGSQALVGKYENIFKRFPKQKNSGHYLTYLWHKYQANPEIAKKEINTFAETQSKLNTEESLTKAYNAYRIIKNVDAMDALQKKILSINPKGEMAKSKFFDEFYSQTNKTEGFILDKLKEYQTTFNDNNPETVDAFYVDIIRTGIRNSDKTLIEKYEAKLNGKTMLASVYNSFAWEMSGQSIEATAKDLDFAEYLSRKSIAFIKEEMDEADENNKKMFQGSKNSYEDTLALILFKKGNAEEAFNLQHGVMLQDELDEGGKERYVAYAQKAKGDEFAKKYIENQFSENKSNSKVLLNQLEKIYENLKLSKEDFNKIKEEITHALTRKSKENILKTFGSTTAKDFSLVDASGKNVKLSDYKGKLVVLDFWATWCGPCRASFPHMKELVEKYKNQNIEFLFINTWERKKAEDIKKDVSKFIADNKYPFHVLYDFNDEVIELYKVKGIPSKFLIDKNGEIISMNDSDSNLEELIKENL